MDIDLEELWDSCKAEASDEGKDDDFYYIKDKVVEKLGGEMKESSPIKKYKPLYE